MRCVTAVMTMLLACATTGSFVLAQAQAPGAPGIPGTVSPEGIPGGFVAPQPMPTARLDLSLTYADPAMPPTGNEELLSVIAYLASDPEMRKRPDFDALDMPALLNALIDGGAAIEVQYVHGHWRGVNDLEDFRRAGDFAHAQTPFALGNPGNEEV